MSAAGKKMKMNGTLVEWFLLSLPPLFSLSSDFFFQFCVLSSVLFVGEVVSGILLFMLMDRIKATITFYLIAAVVTYQDDELVQEFLDYVQQKVGIYRSFLILCLPACLSPSCLLASIHACLLIFLPASVLAICLPFMPTHM